MDRHSNKPNMIDEDQVPELLYIISMWSNAFEKITTDAFETLQSLPLSKKLNIRELQSAAVSMTVGITDLIQKFQQTKLSCSHEESISKEFINPPWNSPGC